MTRAEIKATIERSFRVHERQARGFQYLDGRHLVVPAEPPNRAKAEPWKRGDMRVQPRPVELIRIERRFIMPWRPGEPMPAMLSPYDLVEALVGFWRGVELVLTGPYAGRDLQDPHGRLTYRGHPATALTLGDLRRARAALAQAAREAGR